MEQQETESKLDIKKVLRLLYIKKKLFIKGMIISFVLSCLWIFPQPRYYVSEVSLAPESSNANIDGSITSIASSFGFNLGGGNSGDAIYPLLYPDIISSSNFLVSLFDVQVKSEDGSIQMDYHTYMDKHQKFNFWMWPIDYARGIFKKMFAKEHHGPDKTEGVNPFWLSERDQEIVESLQGKIQCTVDMKTEVITIMVKDQDRLICATMADSVRVRLQDYITNYRTSKARVDAVYYEQLMDSANIEYEKAVDEYSRYADTHMNMILQTNLSERDRLEQDMQTKYNAYTAFSAQYQAALARIQERTPAFTIIQGASVPQKPAGPKRVIFVLAMMVMTCIGISVYVLRRYIF